MWIPTKSINYKPVSYHHEGDKVKRDYKYRDGYDYEYGHVVEVNEDEIVIDWDMYGMESHDIEDANKYVYPV